MTLRIALCLLASVALAVGAPPLKTRNLIVVTTDGLRWQDVFRGADKNLTNKDNGGVPDEAALLAKFGADTPTERRSKLMPWFWSHLAKNGQILGNRDLNSTIDCSNAMYFSYPGYNELFTGHADPEIKSNKPVLNPNINVFEWLHGQPGFRDRIRIYLAWDVIAWALNTSRSGIPVWTSTSNVPEGSKVPSHPIIERLRDDTTAIWAEEHYDSFVHASAVESLKRDKPRVMYISYGETDEWAHARRYDRYLEITHRLDGWIRELWETAQSSPEYCDSTTLVVTTDHGRGDDAETWINHGEKIPSAVGIWFAALGPDTPALGERRDTPRLTQSQVASTIAGLLGQDYPKAFPEAAPSIKEIFAPAEANR